MIMKGGLFILLFLGTKRVGVTLTLCTLYPVFITFLKTQFTSFKIEKFLNQSNKGKKILGIVNKISKTKSLLTSPRKVLPIITSSKVSCQ